MTAYLIYFLFVAINLKMVFIWTAVLSSIILILLPALAEDFSLIESSKILTIKKLFCVIFVSVFFASIIPSERQMYLIAGTYIAEKNYDSVVNSPEFDKSRKIIQMHLDKYIEDLAEETEGSNTKKK